VIPDVAAHAETNQKTTGYFQVTDGKGFLDGGTSASAPLWAALIALLNAELQKRRGPNARVGYLTPILYQKDADGNPIGSTVCRDITQGDNISAAIGGYAAGPGYDAVTGWGSPIGTKLLAALLALP
jgi:kumamolisin